MTLVQTAFSTILRDANDYACVLLDRTGQAVTDNSWAIPAFIGGLPITMRHVLARFPVDTWRPGDVVITNDPWIATGHLPDLTVISPIFLAQRVVGFAGSVAHHADVGGMLWSADTTELYEEGLRLPITHLYLAGKPVESVFEIIRANVRVPDQLFGDLHAQLVANESMAQRLPEVMVEEGLDDLGPVASLLQDRSESAMRKAIEAVPDGTYRSSVELDGIDEPLTIRLALTVSGSQLILDYAGSSPQQPRAINVALINTFAHSAYALKCILDPATPRNEGSYRPIKVMAPEGCLVNAMFPAPVNARHLTFLHLASAIMQALAQVIPNKVIAESGSPFVQVVYSGRDAVGNRFVHVTFDSAGMGARPTKDGLSATPFPNNTGGAPIEAVESTTPLLFWEKALVTGTGGAGRYRGGLGTRVVTENIGTQPIVVSILGNRVRHPARGLMGGRPGATAAVEINGIAIKHIGRYSLAPGDRLMIRNAGGGGYGPPAERDPELVAMDIANGYVAEENSHD